MRRAKLFLSPLLLLLVAGCDDVLRSGDVSRLGEDSLQPGEWEFVAALGAADGSGPTGLGPITAKKCLGPESVQRTTREVILTIASREKCDAAGAQINKGRVSGSIHCPGVDDLADHEERLAGSYGRDSLKMTIDMQILRNVVVRQTVEGRRIGECQRQTRMLFKERRPESLGGPAPEIAPAQN